MEHLTPLFGQGLVGHTGKEGRMLESQRRSGSAARIKHLARPPFWPEGLKLMPSSQVEAHVLTAAEAMAPVASARAAPAT